MDHDLSLLEAVDPGQGERRRTAEGDVRLPVVEHAVQVDVEVRDSHPLRVRALASAIGRGGGHMRSAGGASDQGADKWPGAVAGFGFTIKPVVFEHARNESKVKPMVC